jgi:hypothetical protein
MLLGDDITLNGINGETGQYLVEPLPVSRVVDYIRSERVDQSLARLQRQIWKEISRPDLGLPLGVDPTNIPEAGWGVVFHEAEDPDVKDALAALIEHRRQQAGDEAIVKTLTYRQGEDRTRWLARHGIGAGSVVPRLVPYYLLIVGSPDRIPFSFSHQLAMAYAVGRLDFDKADEYRAYASSVIAYETGDRVPNDRQVVFFGTCHERDRSTMLSAYRLVTPLAEGLPERDGAPSQPGIAERWDFRTRKIIGDRATKDVLMGVFSPAEGAKSPAVVFTASHGVGWDSGHPEQYLSQGAILCQDWPGLGTISADHYFGAGDLGNSARLGGMITFHFACFGAGTPTHDRYSHVPGQPPPRIAEKPFISALPKALLAHPGGGALACIGHVDRAWGYSFVSPVAGLQLQPFQNAIGRLLIGQPVGVAMKDIRDKYGELSGILSDALKDKDSGMEISDRQLATYWIERNDAEGYIVLGDPAVRLRADEMA